MSFRAHEVKELQEWMTQSLGGVKWGQDKRGHEKMQYWVQLAEIALQFLKHCEIALQLRNCNAIVELFVARIYANNCEVSPVEQVCRLVEVAWALAEQTEFLAFWS